MFKKSSSTDNNNSSKISKKSSQDLEKSLAQRFQTALDLNQDLSSVKITPNEVLKLTIPTSDYLCPKSANIYEIEFIKFRVRDFSNSKSNHKPVLIDIAKPPGYIESEEEKNDPEAGRFVKYDLHGDFLDLRSLGAQITFTVGGSKVVKDFRMIEKHYFKNKLIKSFDFNFGAALIPNSENSIEHIYELPKLDSKTKKAMIDAPWETKSDSFYFVEGRLIMHNKAEYAYNYSEED